MDSLLLERLFRLHKAAEGQFVVGGSAAVLLYVLDNGGSSKDLNRVIDFGSDIDIYLNRNFPVGVHFISDITGNPPITKNGSHGTVETEEFGKIDYTFKKNLKRTEVKVMKLKFHVLSLKSLMSKYSYHRNNLPNNRRRAVNKKLHILGKIDQRKYSTVTNMTTTGNMLPEMTLNNIPNFALGGGGFIRVRGHGRRKIRYYKNGNPYVIVNGHRKKLS